ncbi:thioredoxin [Candidatus Albibeggiatoa sp. nov. BB20]|uniref:thioredoxin n=1 Tax=Candidatus Albibeggiatoa sp. nov. BB20 TaxID=3162723 RepID=UPI0033656CBC
MNELDYIVTVDVNNFQQQVIDRSVQVPVLIDFWAEWCAPCQSLMPMLMGLAEEYQGQFVLAKINIDEQQDLAQHFGIRSVPTLKLFRHGEEVEEVMGAQPETVFRAMIDKHRERPADRIRIQAVHAQQSGDYTQAADLLKQAIESEPDYYVLKFDLANVYLENNQMSEAQAIYDSLPANIQTDPEGIALQYQLDLLSVIVDAPSLEQLQQMVASDDKNLQALHQLAVRKVVIGEYEQAMADFLTLMKRNRKFEQDAGRKGLVSVFAILGNQNELVKRYRSKMSSLLY